MSKNAFLSDLTALCRAAFGEDWAPCAGEHVQELCRALELPEEFLTLYQTIGGEERLLYDSTRGGFYPIDKLKHHPKGAPGAGYYGPYRIYYEAAPGEHWARYAYSPSHFPGNNGIFTWQPLGFIKGWTQEEPQESSRTICDILLEQTAWKLTAWMAHCVWVDIPLTSFEQATKCLEMTPLQSTLHPTANQTAYAYDLLTSAAGHQYGTADQTAYACDPKRQLLLEFRADAPMQCLVYSNALEALEKLGQQHKIKWQRKEGEKTLQPETFIKSNPPVTFSEKLEMIAAVLPKGVSFALDSSELQTAQQHLGMSFPDVFREFYLRFEKGSRKLCFLDLLPDPDWMEDWQMDLEDTLLWTLANLLYDLFPQGGEWLADPDADEEDQRRLLAHFFHFLTKDGLEVLVNPERGLLGYRSDDGYSLYIAAPDKAALDKLKEDSGICVSAY